MGFTTSVRYSAPSGLGLFTRIKCLHIVIQALTGRYTLARWYRPLRFNPKNVVIPHAIYPEKCGKAPCDLPQKSGNALAIIEVF
jgi:hypothetical protein